jgi:polyhydroxyalkanoate synthesis repressor PhaR
MSSAERSGGAGAEGTSTATIVRYPNRRLYDRSQARYVTLQEIAAMVREGKAVTVLDSKTNEDLTGPILTQIILEHYPERMELFPVPILHLMIRANDIVLGFLREYLRQSLAYLEFWQRAAAFSPMAVPMEWMKTMFPGGAGAGSPSPPAATSGEPDAKTLALRVAELERRLREIDTQPDKDAAAPADRRRGRRGQTAGRRPPSDS